MFIQTDWTENLVQVVWYGDMKPLSNHDDIRNMGSMMFFPLTCSLAQMHNHRIFRFGTNIIEGWNVAMWFDFLQSDNNWHFKIRL